MFVYIFSLPFPFGSRRGEFVYVNSLPFLRFFNHSDLASVSSCVLARHGSLRHRTRQRRQVGQGQGVQSEGSLQGKSSSKAVETANLEKRMGLDTSLGGPRGRKPRKQDGSGHEFRRSQRPQTSSMASFAATRSASLAKRVRRWEAEAVLKPRMVQ